MAERSGRNDNEGGIKVESKIFISIGYALFAIIQIVLLIYSNRPRTNKPRSLEEFKRDSTINFVLHWSFCSWIAWQTFLDIVSLWNG